MGERASIHECLFPLTSVTSVDIQLRFLGSVIGLEQRPVEQSTGRRMLARN